MCCESAQTVAQSFRAHSEVRGQLGSGHARQRGVSAATGRHLRGGVPCRTAPPAARSTPSCCLKPLTSVYLPARERSSHPALRSHCRMHRDRPFRTVQTKPASRARLRSWRLSTPLPVNSKGAHWDSEPQFPAQVS